MENLQPDLEAVEEALTTHLNSDVPLIPSIGHYLARGGGKRIRPSLVLLSSKLCGYDGERSITHSCLVEFIHTATLLHDDVVDASEMRRGSPSANAKWGNEASVLVGDYLFAKSLWLMATDNDPSIIRVVSDATVHLSEGEVLQLLNEYNLASTEEGYLEVIYRKTGSSDCHLLSHWKLSWAICPRTSRNGWVSSARNLGYAFPVGGRCP